MHVYVDPAMIKNVLDMVSVWYMFDLPNLPTCYAVSW